MAEDRLEEVLKRFALEIPGRLIELLAQLKVLKSPFLPEQIEMLAEIRNECHKIAGTAANFGMAESGLLCAESEKVLIQVASGDAVTDWKQQITQKLELALSSASATLSAGKSAQSSPGMLTAADVSKQARLPEQKAGTRSGAHHGVTKLLLVDDDVVFREYVALICKQRLVALRSCASAEEAIVAAQEFSPDAAIIDVNLVHGKSFELIRQLRDLPHCANLPFAFVSAGGQFEDRIAAAHAGAALFLDKPLEPEMLETAVQQLAALRKIGLPRLLIVDDDWEYGTLVSAHFASRHYEVHQTDDAKNVLTELDRVRPDLILLDVNLPGSSGFEVCRIIRNSQRFQDIPIMIVTANTTYEARLAAFAAGADDYLPKPVVLEELTVKVDSKIERARLLRERHRRDTITGLLIRQAFLEDLRGMLERATIDGAHVSLVMLDIDNFKKVNDLGGHLIGDAALAGLGRVLARSFLPNDLRGRWGGDELQLALYGRDAKTAAEAVVAVLHEFERIEFHGDKGTPFHLTFSAGIAQFPEQGAGAYDLIKVADKRLYKAKNDGRGRVCFED